ncbi:MAG: hypothetical protein ACI9SB_001294 [Candidatus Azotimanducaceae bacterium]|jgi:hypothetical protein
MASVAVKHRRSPEHSGGSRLVSAASQAVTLTRIALGEAFFFSADFHESLGGIEFVLFSEHGFAVY